MPPQPSVGDRATILAGIDDADHRRDQLRQIGGAADLLKDAGNPSQAEKELERLNFISPLDRTLHEKLGSLYMTTKNPPLAVREFGAVVALSPIDVAGSHYNLAMAYKAEGLNEKAREETLVALEAAPDFRPAQKLLLQLESGAEPKK